MDVISSLKSKKEFYERVSKPRNVSEMSEDEAISYDTKRMVARHLLRRTESLLEHADEFSPSELSDKYKQFLDEEDLILRNAKINFD